MHSNPALCSSHPQLECEQFISQLKGGLCKRLVLIVAAQGDSNTARLRPCLERCLPVDGAPAACAWLEPEDNDPLRFWCRLEAALPAGLIEPGDPAGETVGTFDLNAMIEDLLNALADSGEKMILVLSNYHQITQPKIHQAVERMLEYLPEAAHLVITASSEPPLQLARLRVLRQMIEIRWPTQGVAKIMGQGNP